MGILNDLRNKSSQKKEIEHTQRDNEQQLESIYQAEILPKMQLMLAYFIEVVDHLNFVDMQIKVPEYSKKYPQFGPLIQKNYKINTDGLSGLTDVNRLTQINLTCVCTEEGSFSYNINGKQKIEQEIAFLHAKNARFQWKYDNFSKLDQAAVFTIERVIPIRFRFEVANDASKIKIIINNYENFSSFMKSYPPEEIDEDFLDTIARYLLRQDSEFILLDISEHQKQSIRKQAKQAQQEKVRLRRKLKLDQQTESNNSKQHKFKNRIKKLMQYY